MCGRYEFMIRQADLIDFYQIEEDQTAASYYEQIEIFPTNLCPVVLPEHRLDVFKWAFDEPWAKKTLINTRLETADEKKTSAEAFHQRRCIVPISAFYEWDAKKRKLQISVPEQKIVSLAGIYNIYHNEAGQAYAGFTILTKEANPAMAAVHQRMPVILPPSFVTRYLDHQSNIPALKKSLLKFDSELQFAEIKK